MGDTIRWGVLGAGKFARQHMGPAIVAASRAELAALATSDPAKAQPFRALSPHMRVLDSYDALLADPDIDAVYVPLPNHLHVEWTLKALAAGKPVLTEKPIAMTEAEFDQLIAARDSSGVLAAEAYMIVHHPMWQAVRDMIAGGDVGQLIHVTGAFSYDNRSDPHNIRNRPETGGGALPDIGVYILGASRFAAGAEPEAITGASITWENGVDVISRVAADFPGFTFSGYVSMRMFPRQEMVFHGDKGVLHVQAPFNANVFDQAEITLERAGLERIVRRFPGVNHYVHQVENFGNSIRDGAAYPCPLEFSRGTQRMIDMVFAAANPPG